MTPMVSDLDLLAEAYPVHARRTTPANRPPRRESPRFVSKRSKASNIGGVHQRQNKRNGL